MNNLASQSIRHSECAAINHCSGWSSGDVLHMAGVALDLLKYSLPCRSVRRRYQLGITRRHFRAANELRKMVDIRQAELIRNIFRVFSSLSDCSCVLGSQPVGHSHFIQIGISDEGKQAAVLVLPTEASHAILTWRFQYRNFNGLTVNSSFTQVQLILGDGFQSAIVNRFDEAVSQSVERGPQRPDIFRIGYMLLGFGHHGTVVDD